MKPADGVGPGPPGTAWPEGRGAVRRARRKLSIPSRQTDAGRDQILAATSHLSGGRFSGSPTRWGFPAPRPGQTGPVPAPVSWTSAPPASAAPPLVVRPDRSRARRWLTFVMVANGSVALVSLAGALWASSASGEWWAGAAMSITLVGCVFQMVFHAFGYGRLLGAEAIAEIGPAGLRGPTTRWVHETLPWSSIASVTSAWNVVVVRPVPGAGTKVVIPSRATTADIATIRAAVAHFSGGRL